MARSHRDTVEELAQAMYPKPGEWFLVTPAVRRVYRDNAARALTWMAPNLRTVWGVRIETYEETRIQQCDSEEEARALAAEFPYSIFPVSWLASAPADRPNKILRRPTRDAWVRQEPCEDCGSMSCPFEFCELEHTVESFRTSAVPCPVCHKALVLSPTGLVRHHWRRTARGGDKVCPGSGEDMQDVA